MEIYYLSTTSVFLKSNLHICLRKFSETYLSKDYRRVYANKWQYCAAITEPILKPTLVVIQVMVCKLKVSPDALVELDHSQTTCKLSNDLGILLTNGTYSDVIMRSAEGVEFKVHKNLLIVRSYVLEAHFEHNTTECETKIVETAWETEVLRNLLIFVYTDTVPQVDNDPGKLLAAADYYEIQDLKSLCDKALCRKLTVENAIDTLQLAELYSADTLGECTLEFTNEGRVRLIIETEAWANLHSVEIIKTIYEFVMADEKYHFDMCSCST